MEKTTKYRIKLVSWQYTLERTHHSSPRPCDDFGARVLRLAWYASQLYIALFVVFDRCSSGIQPRCGDNPLHYIHHCRGSIVSRRPVAVVLARSPRYLQYRRTGTMHREWRNERSLGRAYP